MSAPVRTCRLLVLCAVPVAALCAAAAAVYEVGPGRDLSALIEVPWGKLAPGDTVLIHWRETPCNERFDIGAYEYLPPKEAQLQ